MTTDVAKLAQEAVIEIEECGNNRPGDNRRIIARIFSPALTVLQEKLDAADLRINALETECGHKEATIGELREKLDAVMSAEPDDYAGWEIVRIDPGSVLIESRGGSRRRVEVVGTVEMQQQLTALQQRLATAEAERDECKAACSVWSVDSVTARLTAAEAEARTLRERVEATLKLMQENRKEYAEHCIPRFIAALTPPASETK